VSAANGAAGSDCRSSHTAGSWPPTRCGLSISTACSQLGARRRPRSALISRWAGSGFCRADYFNTLPGAANAEFVKAFEARFKHKPSYLAADAYIAFMLINEAIQKAKSTDVPAVRTALNGLKLDTIVGPVEMRAADHQLIRPMVVVQAVKIAPGKGEIVMRSVEPVARTTLPPSAECKIGS
jgi:hypothetical protein